MAESFEEGEDWEGAAYEDAPLSAAQRLAAEALIVDIDGFEGPLDLLLTLSRRQKVDLRRISILQLAEQYLAFVECAQALRMELAADYLVMAAWLAFLKSRLLLPPEPGEEGPSAQDLADNLAFQLERLQAMREAGARLMGRAQLGQEVFARGAPEGLSEQRKLVYSARLIDLMQAYARLHTRDEFRPLHVERPPLCTIEQALEQLRKVLGHSVEWADLEAFFPDGWREKGDPLLRRSFRAAHFAAALEMVKGGALEIRQGGAFAPLQIRQRSA